MRTFKDVLVGAGRLEVFTRLWFQNNPPVYFKDGMIVWNDTRPDFNNLMRTNAQDINLGELEARTVHGYGSCKFGFSWMGKERIKEDIQKALPKKVDPKDQWAKDVKEWYEQFRDDVPVYEWTHTVADKNRAYRITVRYEAAIAIDALKKLFYRAPEGCSMEIKLEHKIHW
jgi:hypothetical protein